MKQLYIDIKERLEAQVTTLQHVDLFNNQFERSNNDDPSQNTEQAFPYPCCFIEFAGDNERSSSGGGAKRINVLVRLHIGIDQYTLDALQVFDLAAEVQEAIEGWKSSVSSNFMYEAQRMDANHTNVYVYTFDFKTEYTDQTVYFKRNTIEKNTTTNLQVNTTLDIDNDIIRTGDGA